uniref:LRR receptor-like serine/threonine-protein kinase ERL1 n=1 Tax=Nicotiana tabacum TaxID=4097 RepID=A0A1S4CDP3_TOBAC|nr:PREDICTED: LRR receptor-like serine/threonine-protein kinase ERL1 [Nicotiana tabacum]
MLESDLSDVETAATLVTIDPNRHSCWKEEKIALLKLKQNINYTNGSYFSTWVANETSNCCQWEGIICSNSSRKVTELSISVKTFIKEDISGIESSNTDNWGNWHFNASLFLPFKNLKALLLRGYSIANWIEDEGFEKLKQLTKLEKLDLAGNNFNRSIFLSLSQLTSLKSLNLGRNNIESGNERLTGLSNLEILDLSVNRLNDESVLSALELGILRNIKYLLLDGNTLDKNFLQSSVVMSSLKVLSVSNCGLNGTLPIPGLCNLKYLEELSLSFNNFHGNLPPCLGNITLLRVIFE